MNMNILTAIKLNHWTNEEVHTDRQATFRPICNNRRINGYVVPQGYEDVKVSCPNCLKKVSA